MMEVSYFFLFFFGEGEGGWWLIQLFRFGAFGTGLEWRFPCIGSPSLS